MLIGLTQQNDKLEFVEKRPGIEQHCHSEPVRTLVWESPSKFEQPIVMQTVLLHCFPEFIYEKWHVYPVDCHTRKADWFAMTGNSTNSQFVYLLSKTDKHIPFYETAVSRSAASPPQNAVHTFLAATGGLREKRRIKWY